MEMARSRRYVDFYPRECDGKQLNASNCAKVLSKPPGELSWEDACLRSWRPGRDLVPVSWNHFQYH
jgi:hypothetical protein